MIQCGLWIKTINKLELYKFKNHRYSFKHLTRNHSMPIGTTWRWTKWL